MTTPARLAAALLPLACAVAGCGPPTSGVAVETLWVEHCQRCHAADGRGDPAQLALEPRLDLTASAMVRAGDRGLVFQRIAYGYATMPGFAHKLERGDVEMLAAHTLAFGKR